MNSMTERRASSGSEKTDRERAGRRRQILRLGVTLALTLATVASAQTYTVLKSFTGGNDGALPCGGLVSAGSTLYGTTCNGGSSGIGVVFKVNTDGSGYTVLKSFTGSDGGYPGASLVLAGTTLYGTTEGGGTSGAGVVFKVNTDGSGYTVLKNINSYSDGGNLLAGLVLAGSTLYGTTSYAGVGLGAVFKVNTDGSGYAVLKSFTGSDGEWPFAGLVLGGSTLYGTTYNGGSSQNYGVVFKVNTDGSGFAVLKNFPLTRSDGSNPYGGLVLAGSTLYGTAEWGGSGYNGVVFKVNADGSGYRVLKNFTGSDGRAPSADLVLVGSTLYGTTLYGGSSYPGDSEGYGAVFKVNTDGSGFAVLKNFTGSDGAAPQAGLVLGAARFMGRRKAAGTSVGA